MSSLLDLVSSMGIQDNHSEASMGLLNRHVERRAFITRIDRSVVALD